MIIVKLFVLLIFINIIRSYHGKYCEICPNHTMCIYNMGPSAKCKGYDKKAALTNEDIIDIVNRVNERRNFVAMGLLHFFPQAANMKKISWSRELAQIAQRWADQCDESIKPDKEDQCRDLVNVQVGQNIATVIGPSPGITVRSFVDMWFMQNIFFTGTVTYYNHSVNSKTNYFTQLIWAETELIGCGKAKFYIDETMVERMICNFAHKGNNGGRAIYNIGLPATQCSNNMIADIQFPGLCKHNKNESLLSIDSSSAKSLLRILNLSNNSLKRELDPNNLKQINSNSSEINHQRNQKTRHIYLNNSYGIMKHDSLRMRNPIMNPVLPENYKHHQHTPERGHSRMYHGFQTRGEPLRSIETTTITSQDYRRFDYTTAIHQQYLNADQNYPLGNIHHECTRKMNAEGHSCCSTGHQCITNECTRGLPSTCQHHTHYPENPCQQTTCTPKPCEQSNCFHSCDEHVSCSTPVLQCGHSTKCPCSITRCPLEATSFCGKRRANGEEIETTTQYNYYDLFPNLGVRSGDIKTSHYDDLVDARKAPELNKQVKAIFGLSQKKNQHKIQDSYHYFDSSVRKKRDLDEQTFKPFWLMDEYNHKKPSELKSLRYTTLASRRNRKTRKQSTLMIVTSTESITVKLKEKSHENRHLTEKYLSFDELMHLRKINNEEGDNEEDKYYDGRRTPNSEKQTEFKDIISNLEPSGRKANTPAKKAPAKASTKAPAKTTKKPAAKTTKATAKTTQKTTTAKTTKKATTTQTTQKPTTTESRPSLTANTPFIRMRHCTRKVTCTWTAHMITGGDGAPLGPVMPGGDDVGSHTPPGYVDGCTRTSTCTRIYMDRNKIDTATEGFGQETTLEDEDYCERRSLNIQRRDLVQHEPTDSTLKYKEIFIDAPMVTHRIEPKSLITEKQLQTQGIQSICNSDKARAKRNGFQYLQNMLSKGYSSNIGHS